MSIKKFLELRGIEKSFSGIKVLKKVDFDLYPGEVHCLVGENGAGKSTLIKIISGVLQPNSGQIFVNGEEIQIHNCLIAKQLGISTVYQEIDLVPTLTVAQNIFLGDEPISYGFLDNRKMEKKCASLLSNIGIELDPKRLVKDLEIIHQQFVAIAKALHGKSRIVIFDEPSAILGSNEVGLLFNVIKRIKKEGIAIIYVSHRLEEVFEIGDKVTVLRDGEVIKTSNVKEMDLKKLIRYILGRDLKDQYIKETVKIGNPIFLVRGLSSKDGTLKDVNFHLNKSEILGVCGLLSSGKTELGDVLMGIKPKVSGDIFLDGKKIDIKSPIDAVKLKIGLVPKNRRDQGIIPCRSVEENISLLFHREIPLFGVINRRDQEKRVKELISKLNIKIFSLRDLLENLSGGNQQKVVLAKWLSAESRLIIFNEPTRGVDVGAKKEIYYFLSTLVKRGISIIIISSEIPEILAISDRILIMSDGHIVKELLAREVTEEEILQIMSKRETEIVSV